MPRPLRRPPRRRGRAARRLALLAAAALAAGAAPSPAAGYVPGDLPDLVPMFPMITSQYQRAPAYVDALERPGRLLYRFDGVIWIRAGSGALDTYRDPATGHAFQIVWSGGIPTSASTPDTLPPASDPNWTAIDRSAAGADFYVQADSWHFASAALYSLLVPGGPPRISDKVGFCFFDTWGGGATSYFPTGNPDPYGSNWCRQPGDGATLVRMGISPGLGDYYWSQLKYQWVDVTDLAPGPYTLRGRVNPGGVILESDTSNNTLDDLRTIPGPTADSVGEQATAGSPAAIALSGGIVGPEIPARVSDDGVCASDIAPTVTIPECYGATTAGGPLTFQIQRAPAHGSVRIQQAGAQRATATYTANAGYSGSDVFTYRATDARGLVSRPATVSLDVLAPGGPQPGGGSVGTGGGLRVGLRTRGVLQVGRVAQLRVTLSRPVRLRVTLQVRSGRGYRNVMTRVVTRAHPMVAFRPRARGRHVLRLRYRIGGRVAFSPPLTLTLRG